MDIYLLNDSFQIINVIDDFSSLIWRRKYCEVGNFELHCTHELLANLSNAKYICRPDREEVGIIENYGLNFPTCFAKGRFLEALMSDKVIYPTAKFRPSQSFSSKHESIARALINSYMPQIQLAGINSPEIGDAITTQVTGDNLMEYIYEQLSAVGASCSITCNLSSGELSFKVWKGADKSNFAIFSQEWDNLKTFTYEYSDKDYRNYAVVAGQGEGSTRQVVAVDNSGGSRRREIFVDARDLQQEEEETADNYAARLAQRGSEKLAEYAIVEKCEAEIDTESSLKYRTDFDLGDLCTVKEDAHGISCVKRISEIEEVYENGTFTLSLVFGEGYLLLPDYLKRELK